MPPALVELRRAFRVEAEAPERPRAVMGKERALDAHRGIALERVGQDRRRGGGQLRGRRPTQRVAATSGKGSAGQSEIRAAPSWGPGSSGATELIASGKRPSAAARACSLIFALPRDKESNASSACQMTRPPRSTPRPWSTPSEPSTPMLGGRAPQSPRWIGVAVLLRRDSGLPLADSIGMTDRKSRAYKAKARDRLGCRGLLRFWLF